MLVPDISAVHDPSIGLLNAIAIDRIIEEKCKIGEQVQSIILPVRIGKELAVGRRVVVIVHDAGRSERRSASRRGSIAPKRPSVPASTARSGISPDAFHLRLLEGSLEAEFISARETGGQFPQDIGAEVSIIVFERPVGIVAFRGEQGPNLVLRRREHQQIALRIKLTAGRLYNPFLHDLSAS